MVLNMLVLTNKAILVLLDPVPPPKKQCTHCVSTQALQSNSASESATTPRSMSKMAKQEHCYGSADYWKCMYE